MPERLPDAATVRRDAATMGVGLEERQALRIIEFGNFLLRWNRAFNLISRKDEDRLYHRHLLDSLSLVPWLHGTRIMDLGTGAGLPGIPLAIACAERTFTLVDRSERKIRLVRRAARQLALENVEAVCGDAAMLAAGAGYDVVVTRAVAAAPEAWRLARGALGPGGRLLVMASSQSDGGDPDREAHEGVCSVGAWLEDVCPDDARLVERCKLAIPGMTQAHSLLILERRPPAESMDN